jgi:hypothetical protein
VSSPRSRIFLIILSSFLIILLATFSIQFFGNRSDNISSKIHTSPTLKIPAPERIESPSSFLRATPGIDLRWNHFLQPPEEVLSEKRLNPRNDQIFWEEVQEDLALIIGEKFPEMKLSQRDLQKLTETIRTLQKSMLELGDVERTRSNREEIQEIRSELNRALEKVEEITEMGISDFILFGRPDNGIDNEKPDDEEIIKEYLSNFKS